MVRCGASHGSSLGLDRCFLLNSNVFWSFINFNVSKIFRSWTIVRQTWGLVALHGNSNSALGSVQNWGTYGARNAMQYSKQSSLSKAGQLAEEIKGEYLGGITGRCHGQLVIALCSLQLQDDQKWHYISTPSVRLYVKRSKMLETVPNGNGGVCVSVCG